MTAASYYAVQADSEIGLSRQSPFMGLTDPRVATLRCFKFYSRDSFTVLTNPEGHDRWMTQKGSRIYAILHRASSSGQGRTTMKAIASEAMVSTSTVSRTVVKLQAYGFFAIDVIRGRNGGIVIRRRAVGDALKHYAAAAWKRIKGWVSRTELKVASVSSFEVEVPYDVPTEYVLPMDATFMETWDAAERRGRLLAGEIGADTPAPLAREDGTVDRARVDAWVGEAITEIRRLNAGDPDWDVYLDSVRASYGMN